MTIEELRRLNDDDNYSNAWGKIQKLQGNKPVHYGHAEENLEFWSNFFDGMSDEEMKQALFVLMSEYSWHTSLGIHYFDEEYIREIVQAEEEYRLFISPFAIGDNVCTDDEQYPMEIMSITYDQKGMHVRAKRYEVYTQCDYREYNLDEHELNKFRVATDEDYLYEELNGCKHTTSFDW